MRNLALLAVVFVWMSVTGPRRAAGNAAAPLPPAELGALATVGERTPLEVKDAALRIDCATRDACQLEVSYGIFNPTDSPIVGVASFYGLATDELAIAIDGRPANVGLTPQQKEAYDREVARASSGYVVSELVHGGTVGRQGFALEVAAKAMVRVQITGRLVPQDMRRRGYELAPDHARHLALTPEEPAVDRVRLSYFVAPIRTWGAVPSKMKFTLSHPADWQATQWGGESMTERIEGGRRISEGVVPTSVDVLSIDLALGARFRPRGGIFVAVGGQVDDATGLRLRGGAEVSWRESRLISLAVELERGDESGVIVVPAFAVASPMILFIPSLSIGAGVPVRVSPEIEVGGRLQVDAHLGPVGYFVAFDGYPGMDAGPRRFEVSMMLQVSL